MTKILLVGDIHISDRAPSNCTDTYTDDIIEMLKHVASLEKSLEADAVVWAGDIFHHKQPSRTSHATVLKMIDVVKSYRNLYIVTGNHDISNDVVSSVHEKQPLGVLLQSGAKELDGWNATTLEGESLPVFGVPWQQRWLYQDTPREAFELWRSAGGLVDGHADVSLENALAVTHAPIYPPREAQSVMFELLPTSGEHGLGEAMGHTGYLYYGHIHEDHGIWEDDGVTYANMGAISRGSLTEYNLNRSIKVAMWTEDGFEEIPIPHRPADEVFRIADAEQVKAEKKNLDDFLSDIGSSTLDISSTENVISHIQGRPDLEPAVRDRAVKILEEVQ